MSEPSAGVATDQADPGDDDGSAIDPAPRSLRWLWLTVAAAVAVVVAVVLAVGFGRDPSLVESPLIDEPAPPLAGRTLDGGSFDLADHRGQVTLVNVWASWCPPCRDEFPVLQAAAAQTRSSGPGRRRDRHDGQRRRRPGVHRRVRRRRLPQRRRPRGRQGGRVGRLRRPRDIPRRPRRTHRAQDGRHTDRRVGRHLRRPLLDQ